MTGLANAVPSAPISGVSAPSSGPASSDRASFSEPMGNLSAFFKHCPFPVTQADLDGVITFWNPSAAEFYGYSAEDAIGKHVSMLVPGELADDPRRLVEILRSGKVVENFETVGLTHHGRRIPVALTIFPIYDAAGQLAGSGSISQDITGRKLAERALVESERRFRAAFDVTPAAMSLIGLDGRFILVNRATSTMLGYTGSEMQGMAVTQVLPPEESELDVGADLLHRAAHAGEDSELPLVRRDGTTCWVEMAVAVLEDEQGEPAYFLTHGHDLTEQRAVEDDLRQAETRFQALVENLPAGVYLLGPGTSNNVLYLSPYFETMTGYSLKESAEHFSEGGWLGQVHPEDRERVRNEAYAALGGSGRLSLEYRFRTADGRYIWIDNFASIIRNDNGQLVGWLGILIDVTGQREARSAIARLAAIVDSADDIIYSRSVDGVITSWNPGAERITGYGAEEVIGRNLVDLFPGDDVQLPTLVELEQRSTNWRFDARLHRKDGAHVDIAMSVSKLVDAHGNVTGVSAIARDVSAQLVAECELRAALEAAETGERTTALFLAMMSHELRTPLQSVLGYADLLLGGHDGELNALQQEDIGYIHQGATRMVSLIEQMLDLSRMESGRLDMKSETVDLAAAVNAVFQAVKPLATRKGLVFTLETTQRLPEVLGDAERVKQILRSISDNAVKFTESGEVCISTHVQADWLEVAVRDTGVGIQEAEIGRVFDTFRHGNDRLSRRHGGAGLGLAIAQRLARQMEGDVTVASVAGQGSTFTLRLPTAASLRRQWQASSDDSPAG